MKVRAQFWMARCRSCSGWPIVMSMVAAPLLLIACGERAELDRKAQQLCNRDGGVKIYEKVSLPKQMFDDNNNVRQRTIRKNGDVETVIANAYVEKHDVEVIKHGDPLKGEGMLQREHLQIVRVSDSQVIAELVQYRRAGGDGLHLGHHTTTICPSIERGLVEQVFTKN